MWEMTIFWLRRHLKQGRIAVVYLIVLSVAVLNAFVYSDRFAQDSKLDEELRKNYEETWNKVKDYNAILLADGGLLKVNLPASPLKFLTDNDMHAVPTARTANPISSGNLTNAKTLAYFKQVGTTSQGFSNEQMIDMTFLVTVVLTFFALVLTYDSICGEKQQGTLRQLLANGAQRSHIFLSKVFAAFITINLPFLLALVLNAVLLSILGVFSLTIGNILILVLFYAMASLLLLFFVTLGVAVSSLTRSPVTSLVILLLVWTLLVQIVPGAAKLTGKSVVRVRTPEQFYKEHRALFSEYREELRERDAAVRPVQIAETDDYQKERLYNQITADHFAREGNLTDSHTRELFHQSELVRAFSRLSPTMVFRMAASRLTNNDLAAVQDFYRQTDRYQSALFDFLEEVDESDNESAHLVYVMRPGYLSAKKVGEGLPRFDCQAPDLVNRIWDADLDIVILFSLAVCTLLVGIYAFNRYDVR